MDNDVTMNIRMTSEMKKAFLKHSQEYFGLPASQVVRFLIANELSEEGIKLNGAWITKKPKNKNAFEFTTEYIKRK